MIPIAANIKETTVAPSQTLPVFLNAFLRMNGAINIIQKLIARTSASLQFQKGIKTLGV